jgi:KTSC domain
MDYISVSSSSIAAVAYESGTSTLGARCMNGSEYHYFGVPEDVFLGLQSAAFVGGYFNQYVKNAGYSNSRVA